MALLSYQDIGHAGAQVTFQTPGGLGDGVLADRKGFFWVKNGSGVSTTVSITVPGSTFGQANPDVSLAVAAGAERLFGPLVDDLVDPSNGLVVVGITPQTSISLAAVRLSEPPPDLP